MVSQGIFDIGEIQEATGYPRPSIRRVLSTETRKGNLERYSRGVYSTPEFIGQNIVWYFHQLMGTAFRSNEPIGWVAITKTQEPDLYLEVQLEHAINNTCTNSCSILFNPEYGVQHYSQAEAKENGMYNLAPTYPSIAVSELGYVPENAPDTDGHGKKRKKR